MTLFDSVWNYLRQRTRNAVLAGFQDALEVVEHADAGDQEYEAAAALLSRIGRSERPQLEHSPRKDATAGQGGTPEALPGPKAVDEAIDAHLGAGPAAKAETPPPPGAAANGQHQPFRRARGRPRKDRTK